jgi:hypothetical protein
MEWTNLMKALNTYNSKTILTVYWENGLIINGFVDTISETSNCLDENDINYKEYYMCAFQITDILRYPKKNTVTEKAGDLIEISILYEPDKIEEKGKGVVWEKINEALQ